MAGLEGDARPILQLNPAILPFCTPAIACMDFYVILGVERSATVADVKRAYKRLARRYHPDINPGDRMAEAHFPHVAQAYQPLIHPPRRRKDDPPGTVEP